MEIQNNKEQVPFEHYLARYRVLDPGEASRRTGAEFDEQAGVFTLCLLGTTYRLHWPEYAIEADSERALALGSLPCQTFLLRFLLEGSAAQPPDHFVTFREMPWGEMYIKPYTGRCLTRAAFSFGTRVVAFSVACEKMGAARLSHGDAGYEFTLLPGYRMQIMVWAGDDEFPPNSQILYTNNFASGFAAEDRVVAGDLLITAIKMQM